VKGDELRVVEALQRWLEEQGWTVSREVEFCDVVATRGLDIIYAEAKGRPGVRFLWGSPPRR